MRLTGKRIAILLAEGVEDLEFFVPLMRVEYSLTAFGQSLMNHLLIEMGAHSKGMKEYVEATKQTSSSAPGASLARR